MPMSNTTENCKKEETGWFSSQPNYSANVTGGTHLNTNNSSISSFPMHMMQEDHPKDTDGNIESVGIVATNQSGIANRTNLAKMEWWNTPAKPMQFNGAIRISAHGQIDDNYFPNLAKNINEPFECSSFKQTRLSSYTSINNPDKSGIAHNLSNSENQHQDTIFSCSKFGIDQKQQHSKDNTNDINEGDKHKIKSTIASEERISQDSELLVKVDNPCVGLLNQGEDDEMNVTGYRRSRLKSILCWLCICLTGGLLRLVLHWWQHWFLIATHKICPLNEADHVLMEESYQGKHKIFYVEKVHQLHASTLNLEDERQNQIARKNSSNENSRYMDESTMYLSVHFDSAHFKRSPTVRLFICKQIRYVWDHQTQSFRQLKGLDVNVLSAYFHQQKGLPFKEQISRRAVYGANEIVVPYKNVKTLLFLETLNPFYVFQIFSVILWFTYDYYYYACVILLMSIFGIAMSTMQTKKNQDSLRETVQNTGHALVIDENGQVHEIPTNGLVPGDIIEIPKSGCTMQCDAVLLSGNCILDESMLTGESVPITKTPLPMKRDVVFDKKEHARHMLFCGTKVIQTRYIGSEKVLAIVVNTGNITAKGGLIRSILYPPPVDYKFEKDSYKFIEVLAVIALIGFIYTLVSKILRNVDPVKIAVESLDLITIVVPPALPAAMTVGRFYAQKRLEMRNIYCISPRSINVAGGIDCCCFDKTGTLTEDGLDMWGVVPKSATNNFQIPIKEIKRLPKDNFLFGMVTCHSITIMNGKMMGDPLDLKMFESTGWTIEDQKDIPDSQKYGLIHPTVVRQPKQDLSTWEDLEYGGKLAAPQRQSSVDDLLADVGLLNGDANNDHGIVREFPFTSNLQRMSVITRRLCENNFNVYCKGSPEMLQQLCASSSLPDDYSHQLAMFAKQGYRVIAMAYKSLSKKVNYTKAQRLPRESIESDLEFLGFVIMENRLKPDTTKVIQSLAAANIRTVMVTGDNILTALSVARDCGIVSPTQAVVTVNVRQVNRDHICNNEMKPDDYELYYTLELGSPECETTTSNNKRKACESAKKTSINYVNEPIRNGDIASIRSDSVTLPNSSSLASFETCNTWTHTEAEQRCFPGNTINQNYSNVSSSNWRDNYRFAMVGNTWQIVRDHFPDVLRNFVTRGAIFARMSPDQKQSLIMELQNLDYCVAMCGDGANDCGALKVAHTGISLSETESSIASPFTSKNPTIACVPHVIKEGRAALVTSFGIFKYMAAYSMVQFISVMILYSIDSNLTDKQYLYIDLGLISVFAFFFGKTESFDGPLVKQVPLSSLISITPLGSICLHLLVVVAFQVTGWFQLHGQSWFEPFAHTDENHLGCFENYTMFAISSFQYITLAFIFSKGAPYRKAIWSNVPFCLALFINLGIVIYLIVYPSEWISNFFQLIVPNDMGFRYLMLIYGLFIFIAHFIIETCIVEILIFQKLQVRRESNVKTSKRKFVQIEYDLQYFNNWPQITEIYNMYDIPHDKDEKPTYVEISAEQNFEVLTPNSNALSNFF